MTKSSPRISFLVPDVAGPVLGPVTVLARHLERHYEVEIVGPDLGGGVSPMYRDYFPYRTVATPRLYRLPDFLWQVGRLSKALTGDVIIAVKAFADTLPVALREKRRRGRKVVVYLDEWDGALYHQWSPSRRVRQWLCHLHHPMDEVYHPWVERLIPRADRVISTSRFLQNRFGGDVVHLGVDAGFFCPQPPEQTAALKASLGLEGCSLIVFGGVLRPHKGCEQILEALARLANPRVKFVVVGPVTEHVQALQQEARFQPYLHAIGARPKTEMPRYLDLADVIVLPLLNNLLAQSQVPCKIFEAMAMAKPLVASAVSDLPEILGDCGWVVPPGDVRAMADALRSILSDAERARIRGRAAREKCMQRYSQVQTERQLVALIEQVWKEPAAQ